MKVREKSFGEEKLGVNFGRNQSGIWVSINKETNFIYF
jgi:hypothetical protein